MRIIIKSNLKSIRKEKGITVRQLAELSGCSRTYISDIENNHKIPTIYTLCLLAVALGVKPEELYSYEVVTSLRDN